MGLTVLLAVYIDRKRVRETTKVFTFREYICEREKESIHLPCVYMTHSFADRALLQILIGFFCGCW